MANNARKRPQRERLLEGMVEVAYQRGYAAANVSAVIAEAGVSRPTFYDYFANIDACFLAAIENIQVGLLAAVEETLEDRDPAEALPAAVTRVLQFATEERAKARFLMGESMSGGRAALDVRDAGIARIAATIERAQADAKPTTPLADVDCRVVLGSIYRMVAMRLRRRPRRLSKLADELLAWLCAYETPAGKRRWQTLSPGAVAERSEHVPTVPVQQMPSVFPPGRAWASETEIAENHRGRILWAVTRLAAQQGYNATRVEDIKRLARIKSTVFYRHFSNKQDAFMTAHELGLQQLIDVTTKAFLAEDTWPQRSWEAGRALTQLLQENPLIAHVGFVDAYAVGPGAVQRIEDSHTAFLFFLQEGLTQRPEREPASLAVMEAVISSVFEVIYLQARVPDDPQIAAMLGYIAHLWLTPFLGVRKANAFIDRQLRSGGAPGRPRKQRDRANL